MLGQIVKLLVGLGIVIALKSGLKAIFGGDDEHMILRAVRYCLLVVFSAGVYPLTFKYFQKIGKKK